ncbi:MAG: recombinase RecT, partial [Proteobacteria bacterium]|nr:recombinase RecT [Pseudomonadota bacterium]
MNSNQQLAIKQNTDTVRAVLERMKPQLALALPKHLTPDRLLRVTMTAIQNNPKLLDCDRTSLFAAVMTSAQLGLEPDGVLGQAYLVPYAGKVQFIPGYKGYLQLARQSGEISTIQAHEVCANDQFDYAYGLNERLDHVPADGDRGEITHFYAYAKYKDGGHIFEVMTRADVDAVRDNAQAYKAFKAKKIKSTPWVDHYIQMGRKTAIRRLANYLPLSVQRAAVLDAAYEQGKFATIDNFGDVVIEGQADEVADQTQTGAKGATARLDQLADAGKTAAK